MFLIMLSSKGKEPGFYLSVLVLHFKLHHQPLQKEKCVSDCAHLVDIIEALKQACSVYLVEGWAALFPVILGCISI